MRNTYYTPRTRRTPKRTPQRVAMGGAWTKLPRSYILNSGTVLVLSRDKRSNFKINITKQKFK